MKKIIALLTALLLICTLCACSKTKENLSTDAPVSSTIETTDFVAPTNYAAVVLLKINPEFKLYLDAANNILGVEPLNDDAKTFGSEIKTWTNTKLDSVVEKIITAANTKGFITENDKQISISVSEIKDQNVKAADILDASKKAVDTTAKKLDITVKVATKDVTADTQTSSKTEETSSKKAPISSTSSKTDSHTHSFKAATCTAPKTCSCGATEGSALGHAYKDGKCSRCGTADPNAVKYTSVLTKVGFWSCRYIYMNGDVGEQLLDSTLIFKAPAGGDYEDNMVFVGGSRPAEPEDITYYPEEVFEYNGKKYVGAFGNGGNTLGKVEENGNSIIITDPDGDGDKLELKRINETTLKVVACSGSFSDLRKVPVGTTLTYSAELQ